jgi:hypothetical protein
LVAVTVTEVRYRCRRCDADVPYKPGRIDRWCECGGILRPVVVRGYEFNPENFPARSFRVAGVGEQAPLVGALLFVMRQIDEMRGPKPPRRFGR